MGLVKYPDHLVFGLDIGTRSLVGTVGYRENEHLFRVVAQYVLEHETRAMLDGQIHDIAKVSESIVLLRRKLEAQVGRELKDVCIAAAGRVLKTVTVRAELDFLQETVVGQDEIHSLDMLGVEKAYNVLREESHTADIKFYCVGYSVVRYYLNDYPITKLEDHKGTQIAADLIATFLPEEVIDGLYSSVEHAGLQVVNLTLEPIAAISVAIPEKFRLLNIALVDIGAGTSDISVTKDGSITAYGMIPKAGDMITEQLAKRYLVDFQTAEKLKQQMKKKQAAFLDIMGLKQKVTGDELKQSAEESIQSLSREIAEKIIGMNGGKTVSAVFLVGGGGKIPGFTDRLAEELGLPAERVALRGEEVLGEVEFLQEGIKKDPLLVTPVGICYTYYETRNNFIYLMINGERIKLYDNNKLTVVDAALQIGFPNEDLFPKRGKPIHFTINGAKRVIRGEPGEAAVITLNGKEVGMTSPIQKSDIIMITPSTAGADAAYEIRSLPEYRSTIEFIFNGKHVICPKFVQSAGGLVSEFHKIKDGDAIEILNYYTLEQVLEFMDVDYSGTIQINHVPAVPEDKVYENFSVDCNIEESTMHHFLPEPGIQSAAQDSLTQAVIHIKVNGTPVTMTGKPKYILVDVLDFYDFDTTKIKGDGLEVKLNSEVVQGFIAPVKEGDTIAMYWKE